MKKKAIISLQEELTKSKGIIEAIGDGISIQDTNCIILYQNQIHKNIFGDHTGAYCYKAYRLRNKVCEGCPVFQTFKDHTIHTVQREIQTGKGTKYLEITTSPLKDSKGKIISGIEVVRDVTEQKQAEIALRLSEERYRVTVNNLSSALHVADKNLNIILANKELFKWQKRLGLETDIIGENIFKVYPFLPNKVKKEYKKIFETGKPLKTEESTVVKGKVIITETSKIPIFKEDKVTKVITVMRDITKLKHAEELLKKTEEKYRNILSTSIDGFWIMSTDGNILEVNDSYCRLTGYSREEILSMNVRDIDATETPEETSSRIQQLMKNRGGRFETRHRCKDGSILDIENSVFYESRFKQFFGFIRDITHRKKTEEALRERDEKLEIEAHNLEETNIALKVLLKRREEDKAELEEKVLLNMKELVLPYLEKLKICRLDEKQKFYVNILESNLNEIISPFAHRLSSKFLNFTPTEIQVANLLQQRKTNKEIGELLYSSTRTIAFHRENIRKKLGLKNKKINLKSYLLSFA